MTLDALSTPALLLDHDRLDKNLRTMAERGSRLGVALRPHLKTAKCAEVAALARRHGARGFTVSTLREAEFFHARGCDDLVYPATPVGPKLARAAALLAAGCRLRVTVEQPAGAALLAAAGRAHGVTFEALIEINSGEHRAGLAPDSPDLLATAAALRDGARLAGVLTHAGHSYGARSPEEFHAIATAERMAAVTAAGRLRAAGFPCDIVSAGSTPTAVFAGDCTGLTEFRPGVYMLGDAFQAGLGAVSMDDVAVSVLASVIGHQAATGTLLIDAGSMALTKDRSTASLPPELDAGFGWVADEDGRLLPGWRLRAAYQEHGVVEAPHPIDPAAFPLGTRLRVIPNHSCLTAAQFDFYEVHRGREILDRWERIRGW